MKFWQAINQALREEMQLDERVVVLGEDVAAAGGTYGATRGLLDEFGPDRVRDTPISEQAIVGAATGAALLGLRPVAEILFMDFALLCVEQLVHQAAKLHYFSDGRLSVPLVVKTACGLGEGFGAHHGSTVESWFASVPGLKVVWPSNPADAKGLLKAAIRDDNPVVFIESLGLRRMSSEVASGEPVPIGEAAIVRPGTDITVVAYGAAVPLVLQAAELLAGAHHVAIEAIDARSIQPFDIELVKDSVRRTHRCLIVQEGPTTHGVGAEWASRIQEEVFDELDAPVTRIGAPFGFSPAFRRYERQWSPDAEAVVAAALQLLSGPALLQEV